MITKISNYTDFVLINTKNEMSMLVNPKDEYIGRDLINTGQWEPYMNDIFNKYIKKGMNVVDIGANIGAHTLSLSKIVEDGNVYAFEPCKINYDILLFNCLNNDLKNVTLYKAGCGDVEKNMYIESRWNTTSDWKNYGCIILQEENKEQDNECIKIITIDSLNLKIDFMKIDAEYMEDKVLLGSLETIKKCKPIIIVEIHQEEIPAIKSILDSVNYSLTYIGGFDFLAEPL